MKRVFFITEEVAERERVSVRAIHGLTAANAIPHRRLANTRRVLFLEHELEAWEDGAELEVVETAGGGKVVRPVGSAS